ncbi:hypothetical protein CYMTET_23061 [Cymbomonas tetramitiformis]|uniref:Uncharacterized protein n=1 Tax=Cymbomonas tetramitiformis TaxID=36881 RepID=A0AAE0L1B5_9CHLO|nr:hypothetical protein CYMTET_23061 [Cymbomonas tetramitiformis]
MPTLEHCLLAVDRDSNRSGQPIPPEVPPVCPTCMPTCLPASCTCLTARMPRFFLPAQPRPFLDKVGNVCYKVVCGSRGAATNPNDVETVMGIPLPGSDSSEAQRRRERGARALEERLAGTSGGFGN